MEKSRWINCREIMKTIRRCADAIHSVERTDRNKWRKQFWLNEQRERRWGGCIPYKSFTNSTSLSHFTQGEVCFSEYFLANKLRVSLTEAKTEFKTHINLMEPWFWICITSTNWNQMQSKPVQRHNYLLL